MNPLTNLVAVVSTIYAIEGGPDARVPFGITSVKVRSYAEAKRVCENTVRNNWRRYDLHGRPGCFVDWLGRIYVGRHDPKGIANWCRNFKRRLHKTCDCH